MKVVKRKRGEKLLPNTAYVGRPTKWGNPFKIQDDYTAKEATQLYANWLDELVGIDEGLKNHHRLGVHWHLHGKNLACWCGDWEPGEPEIDFHAVALFKVANFDLFK